MQNIINKIVEERNRQESLWKEQNHRSVDGYIPAIHYNIPTMEEAKLLCECRNKEGTITWTDICLEEFCEIVEAPNDENRKEELIQLAALCISWYQSIERNGQKG